MHQMRSLHSRSTLHSIVMTFFQVAVSISKRSKFSTAPLVNVGCTNFPAPSKVSIDTDAGNWVSGIFILGLTGISALNVCLLLSCLDDLFHFWYFLPMAVLNSLPGLEKPQTAPGRPNNGKRNNWLT